MTDPLDLRVYAHYLVWLAFTAEPTQALSRTPRYRAAKNYFALRGFSAGDLERAR